MKRRDFLRCGATAAGAFVSLNRFPHHLYAADVKKAPQDLVTLGKTGIKVSRLAQGTGTNGVNHSSNQIRQMGDRGLADLLVKGVDNGLHFWDLADQYGSHPHAKLALQTVKRDKVVILTKTHASTEQEMRDDLDRFRTEMGVDHIDIVLLHCMLERELGAGQGRRDDGALRGEAEGDHPRARRVVPRPRRHESRCGELTGSMSTSRGSTRPASPWTPTPARSSRC